MKLGDFLTAMLEAEGRALGDALSYDDFRLMAACGRAWDRAGRPASGALATAWRLAWRVFEADQRREAREYELADWLIEDGEKRDAEFRRSFAPAESKDAAPNIERTRKPAGSFAHVRPTKTAWRIAP